MRIGPVALALVFCIGTAALAQDSFLVQGRSADGSMVVDISTRDGTSPKFLPVPVPESGSSFTYRVDIVPGADGAQTLSVTPAEPPDGWSHAATFNVTILPTGARLEGSSSPERVFVLGAHYDTVHLCPGADDNASGVAGLLELARSSARAW